MLTTAETSVGLAQRRHDLSNRPFGVEYCFTEKFILHTIPDLTSILPRSYPDVTAMLPRCRVVQYLYIGLLRKWRELMPRFLEKRGLADQVLDLADATLLICES